MHLSRKTALLNFEKCCPESCDGGACTAARACPAGLLRQETPYAIPVPEPSTCRACGDCVRACPQKAIQIVSY